MQSALEREITRRVAGFRRGLAGHDRAVLRAPSCASTLRHGLTARDHGLSRPRTPSPVAPRWPLAAALGALLLLTASAAWGQTPLVLKQEPPRGGLHAGQRVLVDDGSCPAGQIKQVTGGEDRSYTTNNKHGGAARDRTCIPRPR